MNLWGKKPVQGDHNNKEITPAITTIKVIKIIRITIIATAIVILQS